jgi:hypothetical protein
MRGSTVKAALNKHNVSQKDQDKLMAIVESPRKDIVGPVRSAPADRMT